jgi:Ankyrin repeats (many copies)
MWGTASNARLRQAARPARVGVRCRTCRFDQAAVDEVVRAAHDDPDLAADLIGRDAALALEPSSWGESALQAASHLGHGRLLLHLGSIGVDLGLFGACALGDRLLIRTKWRVESATALGIHDLPLLHFAVISRDVRVVETVVDLGASPNPQGVSLSPLHTAVAIGSLRIVHFLLNIGASTSAVDAFGATPLDWSTELFGHDSRLLRMLTPDGSARTTSTGGLLGRLHHRSQVGGR